MDSEAAEAVTGWVAGIAAVGTALAGGVFFAFSTFVMQGLARLPAGEATRAMRAINVTAVRPAFMTLLFGTAAVCVAAVVVGFRNGHPWLVAGALLYLVGTIGVTIAVNVPLNDRLEAGTVDWPVYLRDWVRWNHVRTLSSTSAAIGLVVAGLRLRR